MRVQSNRHSNGSLRAPIFVPENGGETREIRRAVVYSRRLRGKFEVMR